jgi:hypothetical protein
VLEISFADRLRMADEQTRKHAKTPFDTRIIYRASLRICSRLLLRSG